MTLRFSLCVGGFMYGSHWRRCSPIHGARFSCIGSVSALSTVLPGVRELSSNGQWEDIFNRYREIKMAGIELIDCSIFSHVLKACLALSFGMGESVHASLVKLGFMSFMSMGNSVIDFYAKSGVLGSAVCIFSRMNVRDSVSWNIIIHGHLDQGAFEEGLELYNQGREVGFDPNVSTLLLVIQAYRDLQAFNDGLRFHGYLIRSGLLRVESVQNSLLSMYTDIGIKCAEKLFDEMRVRDVISWSVMIQGYVQTDNVWFALELFNQMVSAVGIEVDGKVVVTVLKGCANLGYLGIGKSFHGFVILRGLNYDLFIGNSLVDMYCKCTDADSAINIFSEMPLRNIVSWNSLLCGCVHNKRHLEAFKLFFQMGKSGFVADEVTLVNLLQSCKLLGVLSQCKSIHSRVICNGFQSNEFVVNSLIDAYAKCNLIGYADRLFREVGSPDIFTWSTMISGFTHCGMASEAISIYLEMRKNLGNPAPVTLLNLLEACALSAELRISKSAHGIAIRMGLAPDVAIGTAILDMYSKCGAIEESRKVSDQISMKNVVSWSAILSACGLNGLPHYALTLLSEMKSYGVKPNSVTMLSVLSACCHGGLVKEGLSIFTELSKNYDGELKLEHYSCLVDLLARSGYLDNALDIIKSIPVGMKPSASAWGALLSASKNYQKREFAADALSEVLEVEPSSSSGYLLASSIYAADGLWGDASRMRSLVEERGVKVVAGYSIVHVSNKAYRFTAGDKCHPLSSILCPVIEQLHLCTKMEMGGSNVSRFLGAVCL